MFTVALDASGDGTSPVLSVAGFVSSVEHWAEFTCKWEKRLAEDGIEYFRAVEWAHCRKQFEGWGDREEKRRQLAADLLEILRSYAYRQFGCSVINHAFQNIDENLCKKFRLCAYSLAGRTVARFVRQWAIDEKIGNIEMVFESGDQGDTDLQHRLSHDMGFLPIFRPKRDMTTPDGTTICRFVPLQAADWLAYELSRLVRSAGEETVDFEDLRWPMQQFYRFPGTPYHYTVEDTHKLESLIRSSRDLNEWTINLKGSLPKLGKNEK